jgi:hypothetical protein
MWAPSTSIAGGELNVLRWDLDHVAAAGWRMLDGADGVAAPMLERSRLSSNKRNIGTIIIITDLDRLHVRSSLPSTAWSIMPRSHSTRMSGVH